MRIEHQTPAFLHEGQGDLYRVRPDDTVQPIEMPDTYPYGSDRKVAPMMGTDPVTKAVDDYLLMERKARAWGEALRISDSSALQRSDLDFIWGLVHPAQERSS